MPPVNVDPPLGIYPGDNFDVVQNLKRKKKRKLWSNINYLNEIPPYQKQCLIIRSHIADTIIHVPTLQPCTQYKKD